jgi:hypothetical protein
VWARVSRNVCMEVTSLLHRKPNFSLYTAGSCGLRNVLPAVVMFRLTGYLGVVVTLRFQRDRSLACLSVRCRI